MLVAVSLLTGRGKGRGDARKQAAPPTGTSSGPDEAGPEASSLPPFPQGRRGDFIQSIRLRLLNFRNLAFFTAFFGLAGTALTLLEIPRVATLIAAHGMGFFGIRVVAGKFDKW